MSKRYLFFCVLNACLFLAILLVTQKIYILSSKDNYVFTAAHFIEKIIFKEPSVKKRDVLLINTSYDKAFVDYHDSQGVGKISIVDRTKLMALFKKLSENKSYKYVIIDIFFQDKSKVDDSLVASLKALDNSIIASKEHLKLKEDKFLTVNKGLAETELLNTFYKYKLYNTSNLITKKSIPLKVFENLQQKTVQPGRFLLHYNNNFILNDFVPKYYITRHNTFVEDKYQYINLNDIINVPGLIEELTSNKPLIVIGDYQNDVINTAIEPSMPGSLILLNTVLSLENGINQFSWLLFVFLFMIFFLFSYLVIPRVKKSQSQNLMSRVLKRVLTLTGYTVVMILFSIVVIIGFKTFLNLALVGLIFYFEMYLFQKSQRLSAFIFKIDATD